MAGRTGLPEAGSRLRTAAAAALALAVGLGLPARSVAQPGPSVTVFNRSFPAEIPQDTAFSCRVPIAFSGFAPGDAARILFEGVPPTSPRSGSNVILDTTLTLESTSHSATFDLRDTLSSRFQAGSIAGWDVRLTIQVTRGTTTVFNGATQLDIAGDCIIPLVTTTTTTTVATDALPPEGFLAAGGTEVKGEQGSYCWTAPSTGTAVCADSVFLDPANPLSVRQGEQVTLRFATAEQPRQLSLFRHDRHSPSKPAFGGVAVPIGTANPATFTVEPPEGTAWLVVSSQWQQGSSITFFKLHVLPPVAAPATGTPAVVALTG